MPPEMNDARQDRDDLSPAASTPAPTADDFDEAFSAAAASPGIRRVWELAAPDLPPQVEPFSFVSAGLLRHVGQTLVPRYRQGHPAAPASAACPPRRPRRGDRAPASRTVDGSRTGHFNNVTQQMQSLVPPMPQQEANFATEHKCAFWAAG